MLWCIRNGHANGLNGLISADSLRECRGTDGAASQTGTSAPRIVERSAVIATESFSIGRDDNISLARRNPFGYVRLTSGDLCNAVAPFHSDSVQRGGDDVAGQR